MLISHSWIQTKHFRGRVLHQVDRWQGIRSGWFWRPNQGKVCSLWRRPSARRRWEIDEKNALRTWSKMDWSAVEASLRIATNEAIRMLSFALDQSSRHFYNIALEKWRLRHRNDTNLEVKFDCFTIADNIRNDLRTFCYCELKQFIVGKLRKDMYDVVEVWQCHFLKRLEFRCLGGRLTIFKKISQALQLWRMATYNLPSGSFL